MQNGKEKLSDREKYRQLSVNTEDTLRIPEAVKKHAATNELVLKWVSKKKIQEGGGYHRSGWIPFEFSDELKEKLPTSEVGFFNGVFLERGDLVLAVRPIEMHQQHVKRIQERTRRQTDGLEELKDVKGKKILRTDE